MWFMLVLSSVVHKTLNLTALYHPPPGGVGCNLLPRQHHCQRKLPTLCVAYVTPLSKRATNIVCCLGNTTVKKNHQHCVLPRQHHCQKEPPTLCVAYATPLSKRATNIVCCLCNRLYYTMYKVFWSCKWEPILMVWFHP